MSHPERMKRTNANDEWVKLQGSVTPADIRALSKRGHIEKLSLTDIPLLRARTAQAFLTLPSVSWLWLWCDVTRTAMKSVVGTQGLKVLDVLSLTGPGKLERFAAATSLETFRGNHYLREEDLLEIATCKSLREIGAQNASLSARAIQALLDLPKLESLDLEATEINDEMAQKLSTSQRLVSLDLGATKITRKGLVHVCQMRQLRSLDLWATQIEEDDIELLHQLPNLEYLSLGEVEGSTKFDAERLIPRVTSIPSLQRIWLDGVAVSPHQKARLESRFVSVRIT